MEIFLSLALCLSACSLFTGTEYMFEFPLSNVGIGADVYPYIFAFTRLPFVCYNGFSFSLFRLLFIVSSLFSLPLLLFSSASTPCLHGEMKFCLKIIQSFRCFCFCFVCVCVRCFVFFPYPCSNILIIAFTRYTLIYFIYILFLFFSRVRSLHPSSANTRFVAGMPFCTQLFFCFIQFF